MKPQKGALYVQCDINFDSRLKPLKLKSYNEVKKKKDRSEGGGGQRGKECEISCCFFVDCMCK